MLPAFSTHQSTFETPPGSARDPVYAERVRITSPTANQRPTDPAPVLSAWLAEAATPAPTWTLTASTSRESLIVEYCPPSHASAHDVHSRGCGVPRISYATATSGPPSPRV